MSAFEPRPPFYLGIDLGGTNIQSGVVDDTGRPVSSVSIATEADRGPVVGVENLARAGRMAVEASGVGWDAISAVGLGSPGTMDLSRGMLLQPPNLPGWDDLPIRDLLAAKLGKRTVLQNDANAAAFGEYWAGSGRNTKSLVMFTLGTGIGCGIIVEGRIIEGRHSHGGECGHIIIQMENGRRCGCGAYGHLEAYASATALVKRAQEMLEDESVKTSLRDIPIDQITSRAINLAAEAGDDAARRLMKETAYYLAVGATTLLHTIDPDIVLFGGGMIAAGDGFLEDIRQHVQTMAFPAVSEGSRIEYAELGGDAGFIGAAGWAREIFGR
ncbi:ROK family protein [Paludisphaera sp.]|uniref:ROK family protein n=1 Tax=Paludisphaera sp. TaxID=2017432 RepID=UPI00301DABCB